MSRAKSPVKLVCKRPFLDVGDDIKVCKWKCVNVKGPVMFRDRDDPRWYAILHRSAKYPGKWQVTLFDEKGPFSDVNRDTCDKALYDMGITRRWRIDKAHNVLRGFARRRRR